MPSMVPFALVRNSSSTIFLESKRPSTGFPVEACSCLMALYWSSVSLPASNRMVSSSSVWLGAAIASFELVKDVVRAFLQRLDGDVAELGQGDEIWPVEDLLRKRRR